MRVRVWARVRVGGRVRLGLELGFRVQGQGWPSGERAEQLVRARCREAERDARLGRMPLLHLLGVGVGLGVRKGLGLGSGLGLGVRG